MQFLNALRLILKSGLLDRNVCVCLYSSSAWKFTHRRVFPHHPSLRPAETTCCFAIVRFYSGLHTQREYSSWTENQTSPDSGKKHILPSRNLSYTCYSTLRHKFSMVFLRVKKIQRLLKNCLILHKAVLNSCTCHRVTLHDSVPIATIPMHLYLFFETFFSAGFGFVLLCSIMSSYLFVFTCFK